MAERHTIVSEARGEPLPSGRVRRPALRSAVGEPERTLVARPEARLTTELTRQSAVGHLRLNDIVQGDHIVLEGVEAREASKLCATRCTAVDATNSACEDRAEQPDENMPRQTADAIAQRIGVDAPPGAARS